MLHLTSSSETCNSKYQHSKASTNTAHPADTARHDIPKPITPQYSRHSKHSTHTHTHPTAPLLTITQTCTKHPTQHNTVEYNSTQHTSTQNRTPQYDPPFFLLLQKNSVKTITELQNKTPVHNSNTMLGKTTLVQDAES